MSTAAEFLRSLDRAATPGLWGIAPTSSGGKLVTRGSPENPRRAYQASVQIVPGADADLIVSLRNLLPALADVIQAAAEMCDAHRPYTALELTKLEIAYESLTAAIAREQSR